MSKKKVFCGYAEQYLFGFCDTINEVRNYNHVIMSSYPRMRIEEDFWSKRRRRYTKAFENSNNFVDKEIGKDKFRQKFGINNWFRLGVREKNQHSTISCLRCSSVEEFGLRKSNKNFINSIRPSRPKAAVAKRINAASIPRNIQRAVLRDAQQSQAQQRLRKDVEAVMGTSITIKQYSAKRRHQFGHYANNARRSHVGRDSLYDYDREAFTKILLQLDTSKNKMLGRTLNGKWASIGRQVRLRRKDGQAHSTLNSAQVLQQRATSLGYSIEIGMRRKMSFDKHACGLAVYAGTSATKLVEEKNRMIATGEIDIGRPICPISTTTTRVNHEVTLTVYGRELDINDIRMKHLKMMHSKGLLRKTAYQDMSREECKHHLSQFNVKYQQSDSTLQLREAILKLETTRSMVLWHDHSDVAGHSHYLISIWFMYDPAVYKTENEIGLDIQSQVERPFLHVIGRSKSSIIHQLEYVPERISAVKHSTIPLQFNGRTYNDVLRFYSGDLPARQFESGQSIGGLYPCSCGMPATSFQTAEKVFQTPPFYSLKERMAHFGSRLSPSDTYNPATMKQQQLIDELVHRGVQMTYQEKTVELRSLFQNEMKGIRRAPALLTTGESLEAIGLVDYEIATCEPLHDLKNCIQHIMEELPIVKYNNKDLGVKIAKFCKDKLGEKSMVRGCDARLYLVELTTLLQDWKFQTDSQCRGVWQMLFALTELQRLAYQLASKRSTKDVLRAHLMALQFAVNYSDIFKDTDKKRLVFGTPYHSVVCHFAESLRLMSLRSIVTEAAERMFHELRQMTLGSNKHPENVLTNIMVRMHMALELDVRAGTETYLKSQSKLDRSAVSLAADKTHGGRSTILTKKFMEQNKLATIWTLKRLADYLKHGPGYWYSIEGGAIIFKDGPEEECNRPSPVLAHFRDTKLSDVKKSLEEDWDHCKAHAQHLGIDIILDLYNDPILEVDQVRELAADVSTELERNPEIQKEQFIELNRLAEPSVREPSINLCQSGHVSTAAGEAVTDPSEAVQSNLPISRCSQTTQNSTFKFGNKEKKLKDIWLQFYEREDVLTRYMKARQQLKKNGNIYINIYRSSLEQVRPFLLDIERKIKSQLKKLDIDYYKVNKRLCSFVLDQELEEKRQIIAHFLLDVSQRR